MADPCIFVLGGTNGAGKSSIAGHMVRATDSEYFNPDEVARQWGETPEAVGRHVLEDAAIEGYRAGRLSHRQVGEMLGLDYWQTEAFLKERGVPVNYSAADLEADNATLDKILGRS